MKNNLISSLERFCDAIETLMKADPAAGRDYVALDNIMVVHFIGSVWETYDEACAGFDAIPAEAIKDLSVFVDGRPWRPITMYSLQTVVDTFSKNGLTVGGNLEFLLSTDELRAKQLDSWSRARFSLSELRAPIREIRYRITELKSIAAERYSYSEKLASNPPACRVSVDVAAGVVQIDGRTFVLIGSPAVKERLAEFIGELIAADGEPLAMSDRDIRTRDVEQQTPEVRDLLDSQPGAGTRISRDCLWLI